MKKKISNKMFFTTIIAIFLITIAIGYANISDIILTISGNATSPGVLSAEDFEVSFTNTVNTATSANTITITHNIIDDHNAEFTVTGMYGYNERATIDFQIENGSEHCYASIVASLTNSNTTYFDVNYSLLDSNNNAIDILAPGETATLRITGRTLKVSTDTAKTTNVSVNITATSVEDPGV